MRVTRRSAMRLLGASAAVPILEKMPLSLAEGATQQASGAAADATYKNANLPIEERVKDLLARMTPQEKARQLDMYAGVTYPGQTATISSVGIIKTTGFRPQEAADLWGNLGVGSIHDLHPSASLYNRIQEWIIKTSRLGIPALFLEEGLHGYFDGTIFPSPINLAATWNPEIAQQTGAAIAAEARANGVDMILAPVLDLTRDPRWGRAEENFGEDPYLTGRTGLAYVRGAQGTSLNTDHTVIAEPKHFVAHGSPEGGTNTSPVHIGERELHTVMLKSFEPAIREGHARGVMVAYHEIDGIPVASNPDLLIKLLRDDWGFQGFVLSDLGAIRLLYDRHFVAATPKDAACMAINSGIDMQFYDFDHKVFQDGLVEGLQDGTLSPVAFDRAVSSVLRVKFLLGLFDRPFADPTLSIRVNRCKAHLDLSLESARQSMTLLKNENALLPLSKSLKRIAVIGPNADAARYGDYAEEVKGARVSMLAALRARMPDATIAFDHGKEIAAAVAKTQDVEVIILGLGERRGISGEGRDRSMLDLPGNQEELLEAMVATGKPVVVVLQNGRPLAIEWAAKHVPAILETWYPGEFGGTAIVETLFGDNNPAGRLTASFPKTVGQLPDYYNHDSSKRLQYIDNDGLPLFPFGHGLSYASFGYDQLTVIPPPAHSKSDTAVSVRVTNTGPVAGDEVVQLYFRQQVASVETPVKSLGAFSRIHLKPGEQRSVTLFLRREQFAIWNRAKQWAVEPGKFTIWVGGSSQATLTAEFAVTD